MKTPKELILDMTDTGFRQIDVARATGIHRATISRLALGFNQQISFTRMEALKECHRKVMMKARRAVKKTEVPETAEAA
jgi:transcriptional regulator with XRE-family HTH domain